jgi:DNA-binding transcriptional regulator PaaX
MKPKRIQSRRVVSHSLTRKTAAERAIGMTKKEAKAWKRRWEMVNQKEIEELRSTPLDVKACQIDALMRLAQTMKWDKVLQEGEEEVRGRWCRLRKALSV